MTEAINNFRLKIRNTASLKRNSVSFGLAEAQALNKEIVGLQSHIEQLENELLQNKTLTVDIIGRDF